MRRAIHVTRILALFASLCVLGCVPFIPPPADPGGPESVDATVEEVVVDANFAIAIAFAPDGRAFYTEKETGRIRVLTPEGSLLEEPFADVTVVSNSERGLLGIALHPEFENNGLVYAFYTSSDQTEDSRTSNAAVDNRVVRFTSNAERTASIGEALILSLPVTPGPNHNGGNIHFGPDGKLYISLGDLGDSSNSQSLTALPGRILRANDDGTVPMDNPFGEENPTYVGGLRNTFDFTFDPTGGMVFATENGTHEHDEINIFGPGADGGWPLIEGAAGGSLEVGFGTYADPARSYDGIVVPTGIAFAPDDTFGGDRELQLFVAEFLTGRVWVFEVSEDRLSISNPSLFAQGISGGITDIEFAPDGTLYVLTSTDIWRLVPDQEAP